MINKSGKKKNIFTSLIKNAVRFVGSTIGISREEEVVEGALPIALYPSHFSDNTVIGNDIDFPELSISEGDGEIPMWMRTEHAPNLSKRKLKRKIFRNIKEKNRMLKLIKKNESKAELYALKLRQEVNAADELYLLRKQYVESMLDKREINDKLTDKTNDYLKYKTLTKMMSDTGNKDVLAADYNAMKDEIHYLKAEIERIKRSAKDTKGAKRESVEPNDLIKAEPNGIIKAKKTKATPTRTIKN